MKNDSFIKRWDEHYKNHKIESILDPEIILIKIQNNSKLSEKSKEESSSKSSLLQGFHYNDPDSKIGSCKQYLYLSA